MYDFYGLGELGVERDVGGGLGEWSVQSSIIRTPNNSLFYIIHVILRM